MKFNVYSAMTLGARSVQEDCIMDGVDQWQEDECASEREIFAETLMLAVCDGMGGHDQGDEASRFVCGRLKEMPHHLITDAGKLIELLGDIQKSAITKLPKNSGTTLAGFFAMEKKILAFNAGDSRVYKLAPEGLIYISHDHSLVQEMVDKSLISYKDAKDHPLKHLIEFGFGPIFNEAWASQQLYIHEEPFEEGAIYLLCSDGLVNALSDQMIYECLMKSTQDKGAGLLALAKRKNLDDNTSFIVVQMHP